MAVLAFAFGPPRLVLDVLFVALPFFMFLAVFALSFPFQVPGRLRCRDWCGVGPCPPAFLNVPAGMCSTHSNSSLQIVIDGSYFFTLPSLPKFLCNPWQDHVHQSGVKIPDSLSTKDCSLCDIGGKCFQEFCPQKVVLRIFTCTCLRRIGMIIELRMRGPDSSQNLDTEISKLKLK